MNRARGPIDRRLSLVPLRNPLRRRLMGRPAYLPPAVPGSSRLHPGVSRRCGVADRAGHACGARYHLVPPGVHPGERRLGPHLRRDLGRSALLLGGKRRGADGRRHRRPIGWCRCRSAAPCASVRSAPASTATCAVTTDNHAYCWGPLHPGWATQPAPHACPRSWAGILFRTVQVDLGVACGVTGVR